MNDNNSVVKSTYVVGLIMISCLIKRYAQLFKTSLFPLLILSLFSTASFADSSFQHHELKVAINQEIEFLVDETGNMNLSEALDQMQNHQGGMISTTGLITAQKANRYWLKWNELTKHDLTSGKYLLEVQHPYPMMNRVDMYIIRDNDTIHLSNNGNQIAVADRGVQSRLIAFNIPLDIRAGDSVVLSIDTEASQRLTFNLIAREKWATQSAQTEVLWGIFFGIIALTIFYNLLIYFAVGNIAYLHYVFYMTSVLFAQLSLSSHGLTYLWPGKTTFNYNLTILFIGISAAFGVLFTKRFLELSRYAQKLDFSITILLLPAALLPLLSRAYSFETMSIYSDGLLVLFTLAAFTSGFVALKNGLVEARYFLLAWGSMLASMLVYILAIRNILPHNSFTTLAPQIGTLLDLSFLSLAITDQVRQVRKQKEETLKNHKETIKALHQAENNLIKRALYDELTGLPNKSAFSDRINTALEDGISFICFVIKIKGMRGINQTIGHQIADQILKEITLRINQEVCIITHQHGLPIISGDTNHVAVLGGIKCGFIVQIDSQNNYHDEGKKLIDTLINNLPTTYQVERFSVNLSLCAGLSFSNTHGTSVEDLMRNAQIALEYADKANKNLVPYSDAINRYSERRLFLMGELQKAIEEGGLELYFQPQLDILTNEIVSAEALLRWNHPEQGFVSPDEFIYIAEEAGLIKPLTRWVINQALSAQKELHELNFKISMSVNLSAKNLTESDLTDFIIEKLYRYDIPPSYLTLEITETASMDDQEQTLVLFNKWHHIGMSIAIDDFGTGYSNLAYLKELPVNIIKIDRAFIQTIDQHEGDLALVKSIINIGHNLNMKVVAEGVENAESLKLLGELDCDVMQGFWYSRPLPFSDFVNKLSKHQQKKTEKPTIIYDSNADRANKKQ